MKYFIVLFLFLNALIFPQNVSVKGKVLDAGTFRPLPGANVVLENKEGIGAACDENGEFVLNGDINPGDVLKVSYVGYTARRISLNDSDFSGIVKIELSPEIIPSQTVLVEGSLGKEGVTPITFTKIKRKQIDENYTVQDIPQYLSQLPSTTFYSENGNGIGYNYLSIRGFDQRRISVSVNGIPQNDPEDHNVYWLDFPDLLANTEVIQVQRGAGSGVFGYPAIGGSINIITSTFSGRSAVNFSAAYGSYNTRKYSASFGSGLISKKYSVYAKFSQILSGGYRNLSWVKFNSYYLSAVRYDKNFTTQINFYGGPIADGLAYTGLPKFAVKNKNMRRANYSYWEADNNGYTYTLDRRPSEIENFSQPHYELLNDWKINDKLKFNSALFLVLGSGFFNFDGSWADTTYLRLTSANGFHPTRNPEDVLIKAQVDNTQYGWVPRISYKQKNGEFIAGAEFRIHRSDHWGSIDFGQYLPEGLTKDFRYYYYNGGKNIMNGFVHETYNIGENINLLGELQLAYHKYKLYDEKFVHTNFDISNLFLNPRAGINFKFNKEQSAYLSFARVSREPRLSTYYNADESSGGDVPQFAKNQDGRYNFDDPLVKPETMNDFELGASMINKDINLTLNLYYMLFDNEIVKNGKVDIYGQPITGNMSSTVHKGIELSFNMKVNDILNVYANASYSSNKITDGKFYMDANDYIDLRGNPVSGFPDFLANLVLNVKSNGFYMQLIGKYVGALYSDNYGNNLKQYLNLYPGFVPYADNKNDAYFTANIYFSYQIEFPGSLTPSKLYLQVNNVFDKLYSANAIGGEFFPAAERNILAGLQIGF